uniref:CPG4 domain-containing protein n=1 Tax=Parastrongyloides trichosuri TaxID=131310 RepID=A0A0N4ZRM6_PARTI
MEKCNITSNNFQFFTQYNLECIDNELWSSIYNKQHVYTCCNLFQPFNCSSNCIENLKNPFLKEQDRLVEAVKCHLPNDSDPEYCHLTLKLQMTNCFGMCINYFLSFPNVQEIMNHKKVNYFLHPSNKFYKDCRKTIKFENLKPCIGKEIDK